MEVEVRFSRDSQKADWYRCAGIVRGFFALVILAVMRGHDLHHQFATSGVGEYVPEVKCATLGVFGLVDFFRAEQCVDGHLSKPRAFVVHQLFHRAPQDAFDPAPRQIRQAIGREKGKTVFNGVLVAQAGGKGSGG